MTKKRKLPDGKFTCSAARVFFIYSLCLAAKPTENTPDGVLGGRLLEIETLGKDVGNKDQWKTDCRSPKTGISPDLILRQNCQVHTVQSQHGLVTGGGVSVKVQVATMIRALPFGATCRIEFVVKASQGQTITEADLHAVIGLSGRTTLKDEKPSQLDLDGGESYRTLYAFFSRTIDSVCHSDLVWLCRDGKYIVEEEGRIEPQSPWVVIVTEARGAVAEAFCGSASDFRDTIEKKQARIAPYTNSVASLLFLSAEGRTFPVEPGYLRAVDGSGAPGLLNSGVDARFFVAMSRRAIFCICRDWEKAPAAYLLPGILEISEMVRVRWHMLIIMNKMIDRVFEKLGEAGSPDEKLELVFLVRQWLAKGLDDRGMYVIAGDAMSKLYNTLQDTFRLRDLRQFLMEKIEMLQSSYRDGVDLQWLRRK